MNGTEARPQREQAAAGQFQLAAATCCGPGLAAGPFAGGQVGADQQTSANRHRRPEIAWCPP